VPTADAWVSARNTSVRGVASFLLFEEEKKKIKEKKAESSFN
jgi:hypothetical protein